MRLFLLLAVLCVSAKAEARFFLRPSPIIEVKKEAPLFLKPSASSTAIADVPVGAQALARQLSPNKTWLLLEDSDGIKGWFPTDRSNLAQVAPHHINIQKVPDSLVAQDEKKEDAISVAPPAAPVSQEKVEDPVDSAPATARSLRREFALATQWPNFPSSSALYGMHLAYVERQMPMSLGMRANIMFNSDASLWTWGLSFLGRWPWGKSFYREMDVGFQQLRIDNVSQNSVQLSYAAGMVLANRWLADIRGGLRGFSDSKWFLGCRVTFLF